MIHHIRHKDIDTEKWDRAIHRSLNGRPYAMSWYLDACGAAWDALVEDDYQVVMPLVHRKKRGIPYVFPPAWVQQLGVFAPDPERAQNITPFLNAIPQEFKYLELWFNSENRIQDSKIEFYDSVNIELDLSQTYESLPGNYSKNTKRNLKKANGFDLSIDTHGSPEALIALFKMNKGANLTIGEDDYQRLKHLQYAGIHRGIAQVWSVYDETNTMVAGAYFLYYHDRVVFMFSGQNEAGREKMAMFKLMDHFIAEHAENDIILDFEGSNDENTARFYLGFGGENKPYPRVRINRLPFYLRWLKSREEWKP